jgi:hypothetical protein
MDAITLPEDVERQLRELDRKLFVQHGDWILLLRQGIELSSTFYIFIDGPDECDAAERQALLDAPSPTGLKIFIAGRDIVSVDLQGRFSHIEHVSMASDGLTSDIRLYVEAALEKRKWNEDLVVKDPYLLRTRQATGA